jgi:hypothetical protein
MSQSRTLLRRQPRAHMERNDKGQLVKKVTAKPRTPHRRELWERRIGPFLQSLHATKGYRCVRQPA